MIGDRERLAAAMVRINALNAELAQAEAERDALKAQLEALTSDEAVEAARVVLVRARPALGAPLREALAAARKAVQG
jgi:cell division protein FtsB